MKLRTEFPTGTLRTDAGFRAYVQHVQYLWTQTDGTKVSITSDTGQIDVLTVTTPVPGTPAQNTLYWSGYNIFRINDGVDLDLRVKIEYGVAIGTTPTTNIGEPLLRATIGTGSNGSGTITGIILDSFLLKGAAWGSPLTSRGTFYSYCCILNGYFCFLMNVGGRGGTSPNTSYSNEAHVLIISQQKGGSGLTIMYTGAENTGSNSDSNKFRDIVAVTRDLNDVTISTTPYTSIFFDIPVAGNTGISGSDIQIRNLEIPSIKGVYTDNNMIGYWQNDFTNQSEHSIVVNGQAGNFLFLTPALRTTYPNFTNIAVRWE